MLWLGLHLGVGMLFLARSGFYRELLQRRNWKELRRGGKPPVEHVQERQWLEWAVTTIFTVLLWPLMALFLIVVGLNRATGWVLERVMG